MPFPNESVALVASSYALQYNAQGFMHHRDVESILLETNRILVEGGYGIFALVNQATAKSDLETLQNTLLPGYGFSVIASEEVTGHAIGNSKKEKKVMSGFFLVIYQKDKVATGYVEDDGIFLYPPYKLLGTGGYRARDLDQRSANGYKPNDVSATTFCVGDRSILRDFIKKAIGGK